MEAKTDREKNPRGVFEKSAKPPCPDYSIIVHSHLRWDWVWQRPQQFLSRLSKKHPILFVEEPRFSEEIGTPEAVMKEAQDCPNITIVRSCFPAKHQEDSEWLDRERLRLLQAILAGPMGKKFNSPVQWFYDPMAVTAFAGRMNERAIIYDCMDELSQFKGAPPELVKRERQLLAMADVVFAGGPKIHRAKSRYHSNCRSFGCGVDEKHFGIARNGEAVIPKDMIDLKGPVLGFFGVVDERMDYDLLAKLADSDPSWHLVMVGPRTKVDDWILPQRPNIHWLGGRPYAELPHYASRFNVCLMPFALNEATEYINPTKALEYMATGRPVVSSAIEDIVLQFSKVAAVANSHDEFIALCRKAVDEPNPEQIRQGIELAKKSSWEAIVQKLEEHIGDVLAAKDAQGA